MEQQKKKKVDPVGLSYREGRIIVNKRLSRESNGAKQSKGRAGRGGL
jgi:hypothetical protein